MMGSRCVCILLVIAAVTCVAPHSFSRAAASASCSEEATLGRWYPIELASNKVFIAGSVGNSRLLRFILDTGAPSGFIDDSLVEELGFAKTNVSRGRGGAAGSQEIVLSRLEPTACQTAAGAVLPNEAFRALK